MLAKARGVTSITYNPVQVWCGAADPLLIEKDDTKALLNEQIRKLANLRSRDARFTIEFDNLKSFETNPGKARNISRVPCRQAIRGFSIRPNGDVLTCSCIPILGNLRNQAAQTIWRGEQGAKYRSATINCTREHAVSIGAETCYAEKSIWADIQRAVSIILR